MTSAPENPIAPDRNAVRQEVPVNPETGKPYINTVAAVAIAPSGVGAELSEYVSQAVAVIRDSGLPNETNAMFTNIEGDLDDVLRVVRDATMKPPGLQRPADREIETGGRAPVQLVDKGRHLAVCPCALPPPPSRIMEGENRKGAVPVGKEPS